MLPSVGRGQNARWHNILGCWCDKSELPGAWVKLSTSCSTTVPQVACPSSSWSQTARRHGLYGCYSLNSHLYQKLTYRTCRLSRIYIETNTRFSIEIVDTIWTYTLLFDTHIIPRKSVQNTWFPKQSRIPSLLNESNNIILTYLIKQIRIKLRAHQCTVFVGVPLYRTWI